MTSYFDAPLVHQALPANSAGRDFIIGDLHGSYALLMKKLKKAKFNESCDRLFSVGDLIDRGPDSLKCLQLLEKPWFFAVLGNHEAMFLQYMGIRNNFYSSPRDFLPNGGDWLLCLNQPELYLAQTLGEKYVAKLPLRLTVEHAKGSFDVVHAQFYDFDGPLEESRPHNPELEHCCTWGRTLIRQTLHKLGPEGRAQMPERGTKAVFPIEPQMVPGRRLTYVGHTVLPVPVLTHSHFFLDTGAYYSALGQLYFDLTLVEHGSSSLY